MKKDSQNEISELFRRARCEQPFGEARSYGFDTRLRESLRSAGNQGVVDYFSTICWRLSMVCLPVVLPAIILFIILHGLHIPDGVGSVVPMSADLFRFDSLRFF